MAYFALFIALGGTSYAAVSLSKNSVRSKHIKNGQVKRADLKRNAVNSKKVKDGSLLARDFAAGQLPSGPQGIPGPAGPAGDTGPAGPAGATDVKVRVNEASLPAGGVASAVATCLPGERATGGGANPAGVTSAAALIKSYPTTGGIGSPTAGETPTAWAVWAQNPTGGSATLYVYVICAAP